MGQPRSSIHASRSLFFLLGRLRLGLGRRFCWLAWLLCNRNLRRCARLRSRNRFCRSRRFGRCSSLGRGSLRRRHWRHRNGCDRREFPLPLASPPRHSRRNCRCCCSRRHCLRRTSALRWRRRWRRRRWRRERFQILQCLGARPQLAIQQQQEHIIRNLRIGRNFRRDAQFRHLGQRKSSASPGATS